MARHDYYDPDHAYRSRRYQRATDRERPYGQRPMPGEHANRERDQRITREQAGEEQISELVGWALPIQERHFSETKECALQLAGEVGELTAEFQWLTAAESATVLDDQQLGVEA